VSNLGKDYHGFVSSAIMGEAMAGGVAEHGETRMRGEELSNKGWIGPESRKGKICWIVRTGEKVLDGFRNIWGRSSIDGMEVTLEFGTVTRAKLGEGGPVMPGKNQLRGINSRRDISKNRIRGRRLDSFLDSRGVQEMVFL